MSLLPVGTQSQTPGYKLIAGDEIANMVTAINGIQSGSQSLTEVTLAGSTSGNTILKASAIAGGTLTLPDATDTVALLAAAQTLTNKTLTAPALNSPVITGPAPTAAGGTLAITAALAGQTILLNTATGSVATLPAATGTGNVYKFAVSTTVTSNSHKILAASTSDDLQGLVILQKSATCSGFQGLISSGYHSLQMPAASSTPQGGNQGDWFEFQDIAANVWQVKGNGTAAGTVATPFSTAST